MLRSGKYRLWDYCFELPGKNLEAVKPTLGSVQVGTVTHKPQASATTKLEIYDYPGGYAQRFDGVTPGGGDRSSDVQNIFQDSTRTVGIRMQEETAAALRLDGREHLPAARRRVQVHPRPALQRQRLLRPDPGGARRRRGRCLYPGRRRLAAVYQHVPVHPRRAAVPTGADDPPAPDRRDPDGRRRRQPGGRDLHRQVRADQGPVPLGPPGPEQRRQLVLDPRGDPLGRHPVGHHPHPPRRPGGRRRLRGRGPRPADRRRQRLQRPGDAPLHARPTT